VPSDATVPRGEEVRETAWAAVEHMDSGLGEHGCAHYRRRCKLVAPCCGEVFWCRHCHNEVHERDEANPEKRHEIERKLVKEVVCALCNTRQAVSEQCRSCGVCFGAYTCLTCNFFEDDLSKQQYHCKDCGICRVGGRENFFHCQKCGCCYSQALKDSHVCIQNSMMSDCPVCLEYLFDSIKPIAVLKCGHTIHEGCLQQLRRQADPGHPCSYTCPMCCQSIYDMTHVWHDLDYSVAANPMADEYQDMVERISCKDCHKVSEVQFHIWLKCQACGSYNTRRI